MDRSIHLLHGSRLELLARHMADALAASPLAGALDVETIVVPHPGMGRWLQQFLARHWGIAAGLSLDLPGKFIWDAARAVQGELPPQSGYERDALEWRIHAELLAPGSAIARAPVLRRYLADGDPLKAFELAQRVADAFDQYMVYRPAWLERWERGAVAMPHPHEPWQRDAWRAVRAAVGEPHRAAVLRGVIARLEAGVDDAALAAALPARVCVFGVSAMPQLHVAFFGALARHVDVRWYQLNPSTEWWGDVVTKRERARIAAQLAAQGVAEEEAHLDEIHPLLAAWGKVGRDTLRALYALPITDEIVEAPTGRPVRVAPPSAPGPTLDLFAPPAPEPEPEPADADATTLAWLRQGLDALDPALPPPRAPDASLRVHACASRMREVEVLHDALLELFERTPGLTPRDIVVMTPRLDDYAPLIEAVFGTAAEARRIPWTVADRAARETHPLLKTFDALLALPQSRLAASEVMDLLAVGAIARRFGLHGDAGDDIARWIDALRIRWGLDADDRERTGVGRWADYGWRHGLDRLVLGYAMGGEGAAAGLAATGTGFVAPYIHVEGQRAALAGALARFVERLGDWRSRLAAPRSAGAWQATLTAMIGEFHDSQGADPDEAAALATIYEAIRAVVDAVRRGGQAELALPHAVVRAAIAQRLAEPERHQRFLAHGVTVCAMVPMRNVPFRVVCLLGLDDGEFPRREPEPSFQLMRAKPEPGDRTRHDDDRYLFLEALLAARDAVHVSHVALNPRDGSARPPSTVVTELIDFIVAAYPPGQAESVRRALYVEHPAAPYEPRAYAGDAVLRSYDPDWVDAAAASIGPRAEVAPFIARSDAFTAATPRASAGIGADTDARGDVPATDAVPHIALDDLLAFHRNPLRYYTRRVLELELPDFAEPADDEPQGGGGLERYGIDDALLGVLTRDPAATDASLVAMLRARTLLRPGHAGALEAGDRIACVRRVVASFHDRFPAASPRVIAVDRATPGWRISGEVSNVHPDGPVRVRAGGARGSDWVELAISALLGDWDGAWLIGIEEGEPFARRLDARRLDDAWLDTAVDLYLRGRARFVPLLRYGSWVYAKDGATQPAQAARAARTRVAPANRGPDQAAEIDDPAVALLLRGRDDPFDEEFQVVAQALLVPLRAAIEDGSAE